MQSWSRPSVQIAEAEVVGSKDLLYSHQSLWGAGYCAGNLVPNEGCHKQLLCPMETALHNQLAARVPLVEGGELEKQLGKGCVEDCHCSPSVCSLWAEEKHSRQKLS